MLFDLPTPDAQGARSLVDCIAHRRSTREYGKAPLSLSCLSQLLWSAQGVTGADQKRTTPSAGARYPLELRVLVRRVAQLVPGIYEFQSNKHRLKLLDGAMAETVMHEVGIGDQPWLSEAAMVIGVAARLDETIQHFAPQPPRGKRGSRYVYMESGALAQNVQLQATDMGLACVLVAGFDDPPVRALLKLSPELEPTALLCIGPLRPGSP